MENGTIFAMKDVCGYDPIIRSQQFILENIREINTAE